MPKGYWIVAHRRAPDDKKAAAYREIAKPFLETEGRFLVMGGNPVGKESGISERVVLIEFPSYEAALAAYESDTYQRALEVLGDGADRDLRIVQGLD